MREGSNKLKELSSKQVASNERFDRVSKGREVRTPFRVKIAELSGTRPIVMCGDGRKGLRANPIGTSSVAWMLPYSLK